MLCLIDKPPPSVFIIKTILVILQTDFEITRIFFNLTFQFQKQILKLQGKIKK